MAYDLDRDHDENVVKLIVKSPEKLFKSPRYQSIHRERTRLELRKAKSAHKSLGPARVPLKPTSEYLKKRNHVIATKLPPKVQHVHYRPPGYQRQLPPWTPASRAPARTQQIDFPKHNIQNAKNLRPKVPEPSYVDTCRGDKRQLLHSGLLPIYVYKKNFGQAPSHLKRSKSTLLRNQEYGHRSNYKQFVREKNLHADKKPRCRYITEDERAKLLEEMKTKWLEIMKQFQCLPFLIDTTPKIKRKALLEEKLKLLDKDIQLIENHPYIYVYDDQCTDI